MCRTNSTLIFTNSTVLSHPIKFMANKSKRTSLLTVGQLREAIKNFPDDQPIRISVSCIQDDFDGAGAYQLSTNVHEYGMYSNSIWSDGHSTHATVNLSLVSPKESIPHRIPKKYYVPRDKKNDPEGAADYW